MDSRSRARGDSTEVRQQVAHRGRLFSSGWVAGEAIMGIVIVAGMKLPLLTGWLQTGWMVNRASRLGVLRHPLVAVRTVLK